MNKSVFSKPPRPAGHLEKLMKEQQQFQSLDFSKGKRYSHLAFEVSKLEEQLRKQQLLEFPSTKFIDSLTTTFLPHDDNAEEKTKAKISGKLNKTRQNKPETPPPEKKTIREKKNPKLHPSALTKNDDDNIPQTANKEISPEKTVSNRKKKISKIPLENKPAGETLELKKKSRKPKLVNTGEQKNGAEVSEQKSAGKVQNARDKKKTIIIHPPGGVKKDPEVQVVEKKVKKRVKFNLETEEPTKTVRNGEARRSKLASKEVLEKEYNKYVKQIKRGSKVTCGDQKADMKRILRYYKMDDSIKYMNFDRPTMSHVRYKKGSRDIEGFDNILVSLLDEYPRVERRFYGTKAEHRANIRQWLSYSIYKIVGRYELKQEVLWDLDNHLSTNFFFSGVCVGIADTLMYLSLYPFYAEMPSIDIDKWYNLSRWFRLMQTDEELREANKKIEISRVSLFNPNQFADREADLFYP